MASGSFSQKWSGGYYLKVSWEETAVNTSANTSTVKVVASLVTDSGWNIISSVSKNISITVDGSTQSGTCNVAIDGGSSKTLLTKTFTVSHASDGSKTASISCTCGFNVTINGTYYGNITASGSATLTKIARNPSAPTSVSITAGYGNYVGLGDTVTINWSGASGVITGYELQYARGNSGWKAFKSVTSTSTSGSTTDSFTSTDINTNGAGRTCKYRVRAMNGSLASAWKESNALTITGSMDLKVSGAWKTGSVWIKVSGTWKRAKRVWIKVNGTWQYSK